MGSAFSRLRRPKTKFEVLEQIDSQITSLDNVKNSTVLRQKKVVRFLLTYSCVLYLMLAMLVYFKLFPVAVTRQDQFLLIIPFLLFPGLIWGIKRFLSWWYQRKVMRDNMKLELLKEMKIKLLEEVMENETYKVAMQILEKFGKLQAGLSSKVETDRESEEKVAGNVIKHTSHDKVADLRRRSATVKQQDMNTSLPVTTMTTRRTSKMNTTIGAMRTPAGNKENKSASRSATVAGEGAVPLDCSQQHTRHPPSGPGGLVPSVPGPPLPRPVLPRNRSYLDMFVEFLVGDGPSNRYALICRQCQSHNGMALREEFQFVAYRCCYCYYWNPARKQRPAAPRLPDQPSLSTASLSSDVSSVSSASQSRLGSVVGEADD